MKRTLLASMLVVMACIPSAAWAVNTPELTYPTGTKLATASPIRAVYVGETKLTSSSSTVTCSSASLKGKLTKNSGTEVEAEIESTSFNGGGACSGTTINTKSETNGVPWCLRTTPELTEDEFQIRGGACSGSIKPIRLVTKTATTTWLECVYERSSAIAGSFTTGEDALVTSNEVAISLVSGGFSWPSTTNLDTSLTLEKNEGAGSPLYFDGGFATAPAGTVLAVGSKIKAHNVGTIKMTSGFTLECTSAELTGTLTKNSGGIEADVESFGFAGTGSGGTCTSTLGNKTWTFNTATNGLPWCLQVPKGSDTVNIRGNSCSSASRPIRMVMESPITTTDECVYERAAALAGSVTTHPEDAILKFTDATFLEVEPKSGSCPDEATLDSSMTLERDETGIKPMYID